MVSHGSLPPCPLTDEHCETLRQLAQSIPQVQQIVADCAQCEIQIPGISESLANNLRKVKALQAFAAKYHITADGNPIRAAD